ncbi:RNA methyltransferase [Candidatus Wolfebacteria bacterium]|nr:RNA methyltransferase [Candidatus Wolfebacteria bacterium]
MMVRNKNVILELLRNGVAFQKITLAENLDQDSLTKEILATAATKNIPIENLSRKKMARRRSGESREVLIGFLAPVKNWTLQELLSKLYENNRDPFFLLLNRVAFANNMGVIARTGFAVGVNGLIFQTDAAKLFDEETLHFSMGTIARIPCVKMNIFAALKELRKNNIKTFSIQMDGGIYFKENLTGPVAFVLGAEREGLAKTVSDRCDKKLAIPMRKGIDSLNVSASASIILYEKARQEGLHFLSENSS